mgnify:CR=1 FL=1
MKIKSIVRISLFSALICIATVAIPPIPIFSIPVTLQTLIIMLTAFFLKPSEAFISVLLYLVLGFIGLPVFSGFNSGIAYILGPTGGFLLSFPISAFLISYFKGGLSFGRLLIVNILFGIVFVYIIAILWMRIILDISFLSAASSLLIFVAIDTGKVILAAFVGTKLKGISVLN